MNAREFALLLADFRASGGYTDPEAAAALGIPVQTFCAWKNERVMPGPFVLATVVRRLSGAPICAQLPTPAQFSALLLAWRARHRFSHRAAGVALGCGAGTISKWENQQPPSALAMEEILRRLEQPIDAERIRASLQPLRLISAEDLARKLRAWRRRYDLTRRMAGEALGIHDRTVCAWECRTQYPQPDLLQRVLPLLDAAPVGVRSENGWRTRRSVAREKAIAITGPRRWPFGRRLKAWRKRRGLNQLEAAIALGLPRDQALMSSYEKGRSFPRCERLEIIEAIIAAES